ncbi:MAG: hypothetical protein AAFR38_01900 [Planctomycetota bacterium]
MDLKVLSIFCVAAVGIHQAAGQEFFSVDPDTDELVRLNAADGSVTAVGPIGFDFANADLVALNGQLWAIGFDLARDGRFLIRIDHTTGAAVSVVQITDSLGPSRLVEGVAAAAEGDAFIVSYSAQMAFDFDSETLGRMNTDGVITSIGAPAASQSRPVDIDGLQLLPSGAFFAVDGVTAPFNFNEFYTLSSTTSPLTSVLTSSHSAELTGVDDFAFDGGFVWLVDFVLADLIALDPSDASISSSIPLSAVPAGGFRGLEVATGLICSPVDFAAPWGVISQGDVAVFVDLFFQADSRVTSLAEPLDVASQADVAEFVRLFFEGCPS